MREVEHGECGIASLLHRFSGPSFHHRPQLVSRWAQQPGGRAGTRRPQDGGGVGVSPLLKAA